MTTLTVGTSGQEFTTLSAAVAHASPGDTIDLQPGTYTNDFPGLINGLTIEGVGGIAKLVATAQPSNGKAILDVTGNTTLKNLDISGVTVPDANGAAIRYESGNLVIQNTLIHNNQDGILGASDPSGSITITGSEIYGNGTGTGSTHNIYIGDIATFTLTNSYIHDANTGHEIKSRAQTNIITNNLIEDNSGTASYEIDLPNGGNATITGNTIQKSAYSGNHVSIAYGEEYVAGSTVPEQTLNPGTAVTISNNVFVSDQSGADVLWDATNASVTASGNSIYGYSLIDKVGHVSSSGFTILSSRPALSSASPIDLTGGTTATTPTSPPATKPPPSTEPTSTTTPTPTDTTPPSFSKIAESASGISNRATDTISGAVTDSGSGVAKVEIYDKTANGLADLGSAALSNGTFIFTASGLADGSHAFSAIATDNSGNATQATSAGAALVVDTVAPVLTIKQSVSGTTTQTGNALSGTVSDSGTGVAAVEVFVTSGSTTTDLGSATVSGGTWSYTVSNLALGTYTFSASAVDNAGNATARISTNSSETVVAPPPAVSTQPGLQSVSQAKSALTFTGTAKAGSSISLNDTVNGHTTSIASTTAHSDGSWSITTSTINSHNVNTLTALITGTNGNVQTGPAMILSSTVDDKLYGTAGKADLFAFLPNSGNDTIPGFETTAAVGAAHDVIDLAGFSYKSFQQLHISNSGGSSTIQLDSSNSIRLLGVAPSSLQASDFRFS